jgi:hypothetical protein
MIPATVEGWSHQMIWRDDVLLLRQIIWRDKKGYNVKILLKHGFLKILIKKGLNLKNPRSSRS